MEFLREEGLGFRDLGFRGLGFRVEDLGFSGFPKSRDTLLGGPNNKDCSILGSILGSP